MPGVVSATPLIEGQVMATADAGASGALVRGIRPEDIRERKLIAGHIVAGSLAEFGDDEIAVGERLARRLGVGVGGRITLISPEGTDTAFGTMPRLKTYTVAALFNVGFYEYDNSFIYVPLHSAQIFFRMPEAVSNLEVFVENPDRVQSDRARRSRRRSAAGCGLSTGSRPIRRLVNAVEIERNVMFLILALIIVVASFNIISGMIMLVKDKGRDIAILRTMGASRGMILRIFMLSGASIGIVGTLAGFALGVVFTLNIEAIRQFLQDLLQVKLFAAEIYFFTRIPAQIEAGEVAAIVADGARAVVPRDALPVMAGRPARSGRGAALRMSPASYASLRRHARACPEHPRTQRGKPRRGRGWPGYSRNGAQGRAVRERP